METGRVGETRQLRADCETLRVSISAMRNDLRFLIDSVFESVEPQWEDPADPPTVQPRWEVPEDSPAVQPRKRQPQEAGDADPLPSKKRQRNGSPAGTSCADEMVWRPSSHRKTGRKKPGAKSFTSEEMRSSMRRFGNRYEWSLESRLFDTWSSLRWGGKRYPDVTPRQLRNFLSNHNPVRLKRMGKLVPKESCESSDEESDEEDDDEGSDEDNDTAEPGVRTDDADMAPTPGLALDQRLDCPESTLAVDRMISKRMHPMLDGYAPTYKCGEQYAQEARDEGKEEGEGAEHQAQAPFVEADTLRTPPPYDDIFLLPPSPIRHSDYGGPDGANALPHPSTPEGPSISAMDRLRMCLNPVSAIEDPQAYADAYVLPDDVLAPQPVSLPPCAA